MNLNNKTNTELFRLFVENGDKVAMSLFFQNQSDLFYRVALKYTKNSADAEDIVQSAFVKIIDRANQYKGLQSNDEKLLQSWCLSIVVHSALNSLRANSTRKNNESNYSNLNNNPIQEEENMEAYSENEAIHKKVKEAIIQLPEKYRIPIHLKYVEGFELEAIAGILQLNANTLRSIIKRGLEKISEQLKDEKVTLSSVGLIGIIEGLPLEKAPVSIKNIDLKNFSATNSSGRLLVKANSKSIFHSLTFYVSLAATSLVMMTSIFYWNNLEADKTSIKKSIDAIPSKMVNLSKENTNMTWSFINEKDRDLTLLIGEWTWSSKYKSMFSPIDQTLMITVPIKPQQKPFVLEILMAPNLMNGNTYTSLYSEAFWVLDNQTLKHNRYLPIEKKLLKTIYKAEPTTKRIYFYKNYICTFVGDRCYAVNEYMEDITGANVAFHSFNFMLQQIKSKTIESAPEELLKAIENKKNLSIINYERKSLNDKSWR